MFVRFIVTEWIAGQGKMNVQIGEEHYQEDSILVLLENVPVNAVELLDITSVAQRGVGVILDTSIMRKPK